MSDTPPPPIPDEILAALRHERAQAADALAVYTAGEEIIFRQIRGGAAVDVTHEQVRQLRKTIGAIDALLDYATPPAG
jgi:hypothetical protein